MTGKEAAEAFGTTLAMIRYYTRIGLIPSPEKRSGQVREYTKHECDTIELIESMSAAGMSIHEIIDYMAMSSGCTDTQATRLSILHEQHTRLITKSTRLAKMLACIEQEIHKCTELLSPQKQNPSG